LKSSIEYFAMSVGIGRTLYRPPSRLVLLDQRYEKSPRPMTIKMSQLCLVNPNVSILCVGKIANMASSQLPESEK
jgi:hypothetical protein